MGYYFYFPPENKIVVARYAKFLEKNLISQEVSGRAVELEEIQDEDTSPSENTNKIPMEVEEVEEHSFGDLNEPTNYKATMLDPESNKWLDAMNAEMQSMKDNQVWCLVDLSPNAHLVAKGFNQTYGVDYEETFSLIADIRAIRILIVIAAFYDYEIWQMDVKITFSNGYLDEYIYMVQPEGFIDPKHPKKVCKLQIFIYGLKQASRRRNKRFDEEIQRFSFAQNLDKPCVYQMASRSNVTFLILYVDDIIIMGNYVLMLQSVKSYLRRCFAMKDLGEAAFILGIKIYRDRTKRLIELSQSAYIDEILKRYMMDNSKRGNIPMQERLDFYNTQGASTPEEVKHMQNIPYALA
ncbi:retrotransposon protein, putative, ty1-copia subclass [Tanacetum coccineum]